MDTRESAIDKQTKWALKENLLLIILGNYPDPHTQAIIRLMRPK